MPRCSGLLLPTLPVLSPVCRGFYFMQRMGWARKSWTALCLVPWQNRVLAVMPLH